MVEIYDWDTNRIKYKDWYGLDIDIQLLDRITIVIGDSGTGKTFLCKFMKEMAGKETQIGYCCHNVVVLNSKNMGGLYKHEHKLILIDDAYKILNDDLREIISGDRKNRYIVFSRVRPHLGTSPNCDAVMYIGENKEIRLKYLIRKRGW